MAKLLDGSTVNGNLIWHAGGTDQREGLSVIQNTVQSIISQTWTKITFDTLGYDTFGGWSAINNQYTIQEDGVYLINSGVGFVNSTDGVRAVLELRKNGNEFVWMNQMGAGNANNFSLNGVASVKLVAGDVLSIWVWHDAPTALDTQLIDGGALGMLPISAFVINRIA